jgi:hypothetical protein
MLSPWQTIAPTAGLFCARRLRTIDWNLDDIRTLVRVTVDIYGHGDPALDAQRAHANRTWLNEMIASRSTRSGFAPREEQEPAIERRTPINARETAAAILRADEVRRGEVVVALPQRPDRARHRLRRHAGQELMTDRRLRPRLDPFSLVARPAS